MKDDLEHSEAEEPRDNRPRWRVWLRRLGIAAAILFGVFAVVAAVLVAMAWEAMGTAPEGARLERMQASPQWDADEEHFENPQPLFNDTWEGFQQFLTQSSDHASPEESLPVIEVDPSLFDTPPESGLRITWLGHSIMLIEVDGKRFLTDPVWGERISPLTFLGPKRWYPPPIALEDLPHIDAVLISHDHYDHLDHPTIVAMKDWDTTFIVPLGVGAHLEYWGVSADKIVEMDWGDVHAVGDVAVECAPARHASGRHVFDQNRTLWAGYAMLGPEHRVFFSGDTGIFPALADLGERLGPFDVTMVEVGAYNQAWPDWHSGPEYAVEAHQMLQGDVFIPIHWGLFDLALHGWTEPVERTLEAAEAAGVRALIPRPGETLEPATATTERWWPDVPWLDAEEYPLKATGL